VNRYNLTRFGLDYESAFDACANLRAGAAILTECYARARRLVADEQAALRASFSCYYSGNFASGFREGYVAKVVGSAAAAGVAAARATSIPVIRDASAKSKRRSNAGGEDVPVSSPAAETPQPRTALLF
jgi:type IV secretion system protein VirB1